MSGQNNVGSAPSVDYKNYDYASHHADPFEPNNNNGTHSPLDAFCGEPHSYKEMLLGPGTESIPKSKKKHRAAMEAQLAAIDIEQKLMQKSAEGGAGQAKAG